MRYTAKHLLLTALLLGWAASPVLAQHAGSGAAFEAVTAAGGGGGGGGPPRGGRRGSAVRGGDRA
jgi:hypothetical protein